MHEIRTNSEPDALTVLSKYLRRPIWLTGFLCAATMVLYSGVLSFEFVWDDWPQIVDNPLLRNWANLSRVFGSDLWYHVARQQIYYRPLFVAWSMLNYALFGLNAWGWHLGALIVHVGAVVSIFWLGRKLGLEYWTAALAAVIFAIHPIHIEPVAWISASSDSMVTMFFVLAFGAFLSARERNDGPRLAWMASSLFLLLCALLTKEMAVSFFVLVAIFAWLFPRNESASLSKRAVAAVGEALPFFCVTVAYILLRKHALAEITGKFDVQHGFVDMLRTLPLVLATYLEKLIVPTGLTGLYYTPYVVNSFLVKALLPALLLVFLAVGLWYWSRVSSERIILFAGLWLLIALTPALNLRGFGNGDFVRDRYIDLPSVGFAILLAIGLRQLPSIRTWSAQAVQVSAAASLCVLYVGLSLAQQVYWANDLLVLVRGQSLYPGNPFTMAWLSSEYSQRGIHDRAISLAREVALNHPEYAYGSLALAEAYVRAGQFEEGRAWMQRVNPDYVHSEIGMAKFAGLYGRIGDYDKAFALCDEILAREPNLYSAIYNCGTIHLVAGKYADAERLLTRAMQLVPQEAAPRHYLGRTLLEEGRISDAQMYLQQAAQMDPKVWDYHYWYAVALEKSGSIPAARAEYQKALFLNHDSQDAKLRLTALESK